MQTFWTNHVKKSPPEESEVWELKFTKQRSIRFDAVQDHQIEGLLEAKKHGLYHKISDQPWGYNPKFRFTSKKPFDCLFVKDVNSYVLLWFYKPRQPKVFIKIDIDTFIRERDNSDRKSLTEERAMEIGESVKIVK